MKRDMELIRRLLLETEGLGYDGDMGEKKYNVSWFDDVEGEVFFLPC